MAQTHATSDLKNCGKDARNSECLNHKSQNYLGSPLAHTGGVEVLWAAGDPLLVTFVQHVRFSRSLPCEVFVG